MSDIAALFTWVNMRFLLQGLGMTLLISALAILCSVVLGTVISVMRTSNARVLRGIATVYIEIFKNTPLLLWIMFTFFVAQLPPIGAAHARLTARPSPHTLINRWGNRVNEARLREAAGKNRRDPREAGGNREE